MHDHLLNFGVSSMFTPTTTTAPSLTAPQPQQQQLPPPPPPSTVSAGGGAGLNPSTQDKAPDEQHPVSFATGFHLIVFLFY